MPHEYKSLIFMALLPDACCENAMGEGVPQGLRGYDERKRG
jgi:hypothetical protein